MVIDKEMLSCHRVVFRQRIFNSKLEVSISIECHKFGCTCVIKPTTWSGAKSNPVFVAR